MTRLCLIRPRPAPARPRPGRALVPALAALLTAGGATAAAAPADLSETYREWRSGPAQVLMTPAEEKAWQAVASDEEAETFVRLFWARRDPTVGTVLNEARRDFEQRVAYADETFAEEDTRGSLTDRGRVFLLMGPPRRVQNPGARGSTAGGSMGEEGAFSTSGSIPSGGGGGRYGRGGNTDRLGIASEERWIYEEESKPEFVDVRRLTVRFLTQPGTDEVKLRDGQNVLGYMAEARALAVVRPELTAADLVSTGGPAVAEVAEGGPTAGAPQAWRGEELPEPGAVEELNAALADADGDLAAHLDAGAFEASDGRWILPYQVSTNADPGSQVARVVGTLTPAEERTASPLLAFRLEQSWSERSRQRYVKDTLVAPPGEYVLRVGVEDDAGGIRWVGEERVEVPSPGDEFWISELILSDSIFPMEEPQQMLEPYAWQGIVVVPKGDRSFPQGSVLWFYLHACQVTLGEDGSPGLRVTAKLEGPSRSRDTLSVQPVRAGDDCWVVASGMDLGADRFPAGDYEMTLLVRDTEAGTTLTAGEEFTVTAP